MKKLAAILMMLLTLGAATAAEDPVHDEVRTLRNDIIAAITKGDIDAVITHVHPDVVVTWQNSEVCRGREGLKEFFERMGKKSFKGYKLPPTPDELTIFHGPNTGISFGETVGQFDLFGKNYEIQSRWTATLVRENGKWLLGAYHISMNTLDNPLLTAAKNSLYVAGGVALLIGIVIGRVLARRKAV